MEKEEDQSISQEEVFLLVDPVDIKKHLHRTVTPNDDKHQRP
jgi:hypothetical protein